MNFANVTEWRIPQGDVIRVTDSNNQVIWEKKMEPQPQYNVPFWIECSRQRNLILKKYDPASGGTVTQPNVTVYYSTDMINWTLWGTTHYSRTLTLSVDANTRYYFKSTNNSWSKRKSVTDYDYHRFEAESYETTNTPKWKIGGNVLSLIYGDDYQNYSTLKNEQYSSFCDLTRLYDTDAHYLALPLTCTQDYEYYEALQYCRYVPLLPSTVLTKYCYYGMFMRSAVLLKAPELPATTLADHCYGLMFGACTSLLEAPELPASILTDNCYVRMFDGCTSLNKVKCLATDLSAYNCTYNWLTNPSATGTFTKAAGVTWPTGTSGIPSGWTVEEQ